MKYEKGNALLSIFGFAVGACVVAAWVTHLVVCFQGEKWGFLIAGAIFFPIGIVHGGGCWFNWW